MKPSATETSPPSHSRPIDRVRATGKIEGVSFLLLLGVAMPLKYLGGIDLAVKIVGWAHGVLFLALAWFVLVAWLGKSLPFRHAVLVMIAALLPFGPFVIDRRLAAAAPANPA
jgi:integral membrane protein